MKKLPVFASFREVYAGVFAHFVQLLQVAWLPLLLWLLVSGVGGIWMTIVTPGYSPEEFEAIMSGKIDPEVIERVQAENKALMPKIYGLMLLQYLILSIIAVGFHRFVLLGESARGWARSGLIFGWPELLYIWSIIKIVLLYVLALAVLALAVVAVGSVTGQDLFDSPDSANGFLGGLFFLLFTFAGLAVIPVFARLLLVLPHVALGNSSRLRTIWSATKENGWRLAGYFLLVAITVTVGSLVLLLPIYAILGIGLLPSAEDVLNLKNNVPLLVLQFVIGIPFSLAWTMLTITMLSVAYREIIGLPGGEGAPAAAEPASAV